MRLDALAFLRKNSVFLREYKTSKAITISSLTESVGERVVATFEKNSTDPRRLCIKENHFGLGNS